MIGHSIRHFERTSTYNENVILFYKCYVQEIKINGKWLADMKNCKLTYGLKHTREKFLHYLPQLV